MKVIYYCHTGAHTSLVAAAIHLGLLTSNRIPTNQEIKNLPFFNNIKVRQLGIPFYLGVDDDNNKIYTLGLGFAYQLTEKAVHSFLKEMTIVDKYKFINTIPQITRPTLTGSYCSVVLGWDKLALPFITYGIKKKYSNLISLVEQAKSKIALTRKANDTSKIIPFPKKVKKI